MQTKKSRTHNIIERIYRASQKWNNVIMAFASIFIIAMMLLIVADVGGRYLLNKPIMGAVEVLGIMLAYIGFLSLAYGLVKGTHVRVTILLNRFSQRLRLLAEILTGTLGIALFVFLICGGVQQFWESWIVQEVMPASVKLPYWLPKLALPLGAFIMIVQLIIHILLQFRNRVSNKVER